MSDESRNPMIGGVSQFPAEAMRFQPEQWLVLKDDIYAAIHALNLALEYIPHIETNVTRFQLQLQNDRRFMEETFNRLKALPMVNPNAQPNDGSSSQ